MAHTATPARAGGAAAAVAGEADDGRRVRRDRNRDAVVDALLELFLAGNLAPSSDEIAERAGLSPRSLFRYFEDIDDLCRAAISRQHQRVRPVLDVGVAIDAPLPERIAALAAQRVKLFETMSTVGVVSRVRAPFQPLIAAELEQARTFLRGQVATLFAAELADVGSAAAARLSAIDVVCSFEAYQLLRRDQRLSRAKAGAVLADALTLLLAPTTRRGAR